MSNIQISWLTCPEVERKLAKASLEGLPLAAVASYARYQVWVNCVAPGLTRIGEPAEVASAICWLLDGARAWITGQVIGVGGGLGSVQARA